MVRLINKKMATLNNNTTRILAKRVEPGLMILVTIQLVGYANIGPPTVDRDQFDYVSAISESC